MIRKGERTGTRREGEGEEQGEGLGEEEEKIRSRDIPERLFSVLVLRTQSMCEWPGASTTLCLLPAIVAIPVLSSFVKGVCACGFELAEVVDGGPRGVDVFDESALAGINNG